jgi:hypothetical protein
MTFPDGDAHDISVDKAIRQLEAARQKPAHVFGGGEGQVPLGLQIPAPASEGDVVSPVLVDKSSNGLRRAS